jgi:xanthine/CO dehydrogenase XdhC/CoxF family maturation factor
LLHAAVAVRAIRPDVPLALATLVDVEGSSFRQPGARLLVDADGRCLAGAISGGCLEADVASRARSVVDSRGAQLLVYDLRDDLQAIWGFDAACDGVAHILLEPLPDMSWLSDAVSLRAQRVGGCVLTVVDGGAAGIDAGTIGVIPRSIAPAIALEANRATESGSRISPSLLDAARDVLHTVDETRRATIAPATIGSAQLRIFVEPVLPTVALHVIGAGRGAEAFARIATAIGWQVTIVDHRPALLEALHLPPGVTCRHGRPEDARELVADSGSAVALMTHIFDIDRAWLEALLPLGHAYIGVLGSRQRGQRLIDAITRDARTPLHAPIGLDIGGESPESIALATIAEIHAVMHARPGGPLRERRSPIHDRTPVPRVRADAITPMDSCPLPE